MPDHEPDFTLVKPVMPTPDPLTGLAPPVTGFPPMPGVIAAPDPAPVFAPMPTPTPVMTPVQTLFQFSFTHEGKPYLATITNGAMGIDIDLKKQVNGQWVPSISRMRQGILGAYVLNMAMQSAAAVAAQAKTAVPPDLNEDGPITKAMKQPITG